MNRFSNSGSLAPVERLLAGLVTIAALAIGIATAEAAGAGRWSAGVKVGLTGLALGAAWGHGQVRRLREERACWAARLLDLSFAIAATSRSGESVEAKAQASALPGAGERTVVWLLADLMLRHRHARAAGPAAVAAQPAGRVAVTPGAPAQYTSATLDLSASVIRIVAELSEARTKVDRSARTADQVVVRLFDTVGKSSNGPAGSGHRFCRTQGVTQLSGQAIAAE